MSRRSSNLEFSIRGDELEHDRIQLEHNLQNTDLSLHLSSTPDDENDYSDVEYPRHNSAPSPIPFASFEHRSGNEFDPEGHSQFHPWSHRTFEHDGSINPYSAETLSTAAHHASQLTFSAGLGARPHRRDVSLSGAEYDPDRPLNGIIAGISSPFSAFAHESVTKERHAASQAIGFDPLVVDDTAELDRILQTGQAPIPVPSLRSSSSSSTSSDTRPASPRPKLSDALLRVGFSPKRPRSAQSPRSLSNTSLPPVSSHPARRVSASEAPRRRPAPLESSSHGGQQSLSYMPMDPEVNVLPPTPASSSNNSKFTRAARGVAREIEAEQGRWDGARNPTKASSVPITMRENRTMKMQKGRYPVDNNFGHIGETSTPSAIKNGVHRKIHLPDVTGLTSAIGTPLRAASQFYGYDPRDDEESEARLLSTLNSVQKKLAFLESENSISRRRVRELEFELEACKKEVARERTKVIGHEEVIRQQLDAGKERDRMAYMNRLDKGKNKAYYRDISIGATSRVGNESRYQEVVEEKKALENLITTLRTHLSRLTTELSDHQQLLEELRSLRDSDARTLSLKGQDVDRLRQEVERLAGEVEVLRGVVEEGLKERRGMRERLEHEVHQNQPGADSEAEHSNQGEKSQIHGQHEENSESEEDESAAEHSPSPSPRPLSRFADRTMRTDHPTIGSSQSARGNSLEPFVNEEELERISAELEERRSERSTASSDSHQKLESLGASTSRSVSRVASPVLSAHLSRASTRADDSMHYERAQQGEDDKATAPSAVHHNSRASSPAPSLTASARAQPRPGAPTPGRALHNATRSRERQVSSSFQEAPEVEASETPFPQIRGARLERLFFAAPEHNTNTCSVCHRRRRRPQHGPEDRQARDWLAGRRDNRHRRTIAEEDDEGFAEGPEEDLRTNFHRGPRKGKGGSDDEERSPDNRLPPQTVLARVLRELEDDFTHYKSIYCELADQYKDMDPSSNVVKRNVLADHLREVIDILEQKGDQIASLYDLLTFSDKPLDEPGRTDRMSGSRVRTSKAHPISA